MALALTLAAEGVHHGEVPVGAVLVSRNQCIGLGFNQPIGMHDPTAHAEIVAIRQACSQLGNYRLPPDTTLYVTLEPCTMCVGALIHARVGRVVFAAAEPRAGSLVSARQLLHHGYYNHRFGVMGGVSGAQSRSLLQGFFRLRRQSKSGTNPTLPNDPVLTPSHTPPN